MPAASQRALRATWSTQRSVRTQRLQWQWKVWSSESQARYSFSIQALRDGPAAASSTRGGQNSKAVHHTRVLGLDSNCCSTWTWRRLGEGLTYSSVCLSHAKGAQCASVWHIHIVLLLGFVPFCKGTGLECLLSLANTPCYAYGFAG